MPQHERFIGVDYHRKASYLTVMDSRGTIIKEGQIANQQEAVATFLQQAQCDGNATAVLEATRNWTVMYDWLEALVDEVKLAHPLKVKWIAEAKIKTDKIDARVLAHLLRTDLLPTAYVATPAAREVRAVLRQRMFFVRVRTMIKNRISVLLDRYPDLSAQQPAEDRFSQAGLAWLHQLPLKPTDQQLLAEDLQLYAAVAARIAQTEALVTTLAQDDWRVTLLRTIPGLGAFFAVLIAYELDDITRFAHEKKLCSYIGLVPSTYASGGRTFHGRLTKQGNRYLRWAFVEAVWPAIRTDASLRRYYEGIKTRKGSNPAKIATARRLVTLVYRVLRQRRAYEVRSSQLP